MHYHAEIWIPDDVDPIQMETFINDTMAPYNEHFHDNGWWDWWQIGGRYSGRHQPGYDPGDDPRNIEDCKVCDGSGFRRDAISNYARDKCPSYTCNGCGVFDPGLGKWRHSKQGPGKRIKWPTQWVVADCDVMPVADIPEDLKTWTLIVNTNVFHIEEWNGDEWVKTDFDGMVVPKLKSFGVTDGRLVTVDYHS